MAEHKISINVQAARSQVAAAGMRAGGGIPVPGVQSSSSSGSRDMRHLSMAIERSARLERKTQRLIQQQNRLTEKLIRNMNNLKTAMSRSGGLGGGGGGGGFGVMSNLPVLGFVLSQLSNMFKLAISAGRAAIGAVTQQSQTAGLGGFQTAGSETFRPSEVGQFKYQQRIARGEDPWVPNYQRDDTALRYGRFTGQDAGEMGRLSALMATQGGAGMPQVLARMQKEGVDVGQFKALLDAMVPALEDAVAGGISSSNLVGDMATTMSVMSRYFPRAVGARAAAATFQNFQQLSSQVGRGQWGSMQGMRVMQAAGKLAEQKGGLAGVTGEGGLFAGVDPAKLRRTMGRDPLTRQAVLEQVAQRRPGAVMLEYFRKLQDDLSVNMPAGMDPKIKRGRMARVAQGMGLAPGLTLNQISAGFQTAGKAPGAVTREDLDQLNRNLETSGIMKLALGAGVEKEQQQLDVAGRFIPGVRALDRTMMSLAEQGARLAPAFNRIALVSNRLAGSLDTLLMALEGLGPVSANPRAAGAAFLTTPAGQRMLRAAREFGRRLGF